MLIDPKVKKLDIFNGGGGIVEREIKLPLNQGTNKFEIANVPASFDPNSANIILEYISPEDKEYITLQQTIVSLPDKNNSNQIIEREKAAANSIISYAIDFTREMREKVSRICEASSYRTYADMTGTIDFIINAKKESEVIIIINYFINDIRIMWETTLNVNINGVGQPAEIEGFIVVNNQSAFTYEDVELGFAIFEIPSDTLDTYPAPNAAPTYFEQEEVQQAIPRKVMKRTQRLKNLML
ncbi:hypothetical protein LCGC14_0711290 [marine sediment metagenome]|uniref:Uncharacterized protein n=1 Tax=marine sediment metagenome TaxID=412755 RepID=A0A0F9TMH8_9ZZZZ|nr:MAG: hypothetical protein Lokiarch_26170 [Candidatus Lokiarchaeum sp. GC14_75]